MSLIDRGSDQSRWSAISPNGIRWVAVLASLLLTFLAVSQDHMPNDDGVMYLLSAEQFAVGVWDSKLQLYNWPFYAILIAGMHQLSGLGIETSAYVLNGLLQAVSVFAFLGVVSELSDDRKIVLAAAVLILIFPNFNDYRSEIIRGHGYWAFAMVGLLFLLRYIRQHERRYLFGWIGALVLAALFRTEGLVLIALAPLVFLLDPRYAVALRIRRLAWVYGGYAAMVGLSLAVLIFAGIGEGSLTLWSKPVSMLSQFYIAVSSDLSHKAAVLQQGFLTPYADNYAWSIVIAAIVIILVTEIAASIGLVFGFLAAYAWLRSDAVGDAYQRRIVCSFMAINLLVLAAFVASLGFLTGRYPIALALLIMLFAPFGAVALYRRLTGSGTDAMPRKKWVNAAFVVVALVLFIDGIFSFSPGKAHVEQAAVWLSEHTLPSERVFSLEAPLLYRSGGFGRERYLEYRRLRQGAGDLRAIKEQTLADILKTMDWRQFDYVAALVSRKVPEQQDEIERVLSRQPVKVFANRRGDRVLIYATKAGSAERGGPGA